MLRRMISGQPPTQLGRRLQAMLPEEDSNPHKLDQNQLSCP